MELANSRTECRVSQLWAARSTSPPMRLPSLRLCSRSAPPPSLSLLPPTSKTTRVVFISTLPAPMGLSTSIMMWCWWVMETQTIPTTGSSRTLGALHSARTASSESRGVSTCAELKTVAHTLRQCLMWLRQFLKSHQEKSTRIVSFKIRSEGLTKLLPYSF